MKYDREYANARDRHLILALRIIGTMLVLVAVTLLAHNYFHTLASMSFLVACAGLGVATLLSSWFEQADEKLPPENRKAVG